MSTPSSPVNGSPANKTVSIGADLGHRLKTAVCDNKPMTVQFLLEDPAHISGSDLAWALHHAIDKGNGTIIQMFLKEAIASRLPVHDLGIALIALVKKGLVTLVQKLRKLPCAAEISHYHLSDAEKAANKIEVLVAALHV